MNKRIEFIDWIRVVACLMVMFVHASENFYGADSSGLAGNVSMLANESNRFWVAFYDGFVARTAVPLFMIVSAFLLVPLKPGQTMGSFYKRRFGRILPPFVTFLLLYTFLPLLWGGMTWEQSLADLKLLPFNVPSMAGHLWFMYPLISLYLIIPVVSPWLEKASAKEELIFRWYNCNHLSVNPVCMTFSVTSFKFCFHICKQVFCYSSGKCDCITGIIYIVPSSCIKCTISFINLCCCLFN